MAKKKTSAPCDKKSGVRIDLDNPEFQKAWELLQYTNRSVFLTGKAGTGKSTFLRYIVENIHKSTIVLAPTGIAAVNAGGQTLHSFFRIPFKPITPDDPDFARNRLKERMKYPGWLVKLIRGLELIVIDEISMVRADIIDFMDKLLRHYSGNFRQPFGGKQLLLVGDVFQLEPVVTGDMRDILGRYYNDFYFFSAHAFADIKVVPIELRKVYRQTDVEFISLLDRIRAGRATGEDLSMLNARVREQDVLPGTEGEEGLVMTLATRRDMVDHINETHLEAIARPAVTFTGEIKEDFPANSLPTDLELTLKEGAQVVFIKNDPDHRWVNGTLATVTALATDLLEVRLEDGSVHKIKPEIWANVRYTYDEKTKKINEEVLGTFTQYPVKLAWALTVHKSQGLTFSKVNIDLGRGAFAGGQTYVALSRCRSLDGMTLRATVADRDIFVNPSVVRFSRSFNDPVLISGALARAHADNCYDKALHLCREGDLPAAFDMFVEATKSCSMLDNELVMRFARRQLGSVLKLKEEIASLRQRLADDDARFESLAFEYVSMGADCLDDNMPEPAISNFSKALSLHPRSLKALQGRGDAYAMSGRYDEALADYRALIDLEPDDIEAMLAMGRCYWSRSDMHNAMDRCLAAINVAERAETSVRQIAPVHELLGDIFEQLGDEAQAEHHRLLARRLKRKGKS